MFCRYDPKGGPYAYPPYFRGGKSIGDGSSPPACTYGAVRNGHDALGKNVWELSCTNYLGYQTSFVINNVVPTAALECGLQNVLFFVNYARCVSEILLVQDRPMSHIDTFVRHLPPEFSDHPHVFSSCFSINSKKHESWLQNEPIFMILGPRGKKICQGTFSLQNSVTFQNVSELGSAYETHNLRHCAYPPIS